MRCPKCGCENLKGDRLELMEMLERMLKEEQDGKNS